MALEPRAGLGSSSRSTAGRRAAPTPGSTRQRSVGQKEKSSHDSWGARSIQWQELGKTRCSQDQIIKEICESCVERVCGGRDIAAPSWARQESVLPRGRIVVLWSAQGSVPRPGFLEADLFCSQPASRASALLPASSRAHRQSLSTGCSAAVSCPRCPACSVLRWARRVPNLPLSKRNKKYSRFIKRTSSARLCALDAKNGRLGASSVIDHPQHPLAQPAVNQKSRGSATAARSSCKRRGHLKGHRPSWQMSQLP